MKLVLTALVAGLMVAGAVAQERCGCNKPNVNKPKQSVVVPGKQKPSAPAPGRQRAEQKPAPKPARAV